MTKCWLPEVKNANRSYLLPNELCSKTAGGVADKARACPCMLEALGLIPAVGDKIMSVLCNATETIH